MATTTYDAISLWLENWIKYYIIQQSVVKRVYARVYIIIYVRIFLRGRSHVPRGKGVRVPNRRVARATPNTYRQCVNNTVFDAKNYGNAAVPVDVRESRPVLHT